MNNLEKTFLSMLKTALWDTQFFYEADVTAKALFEEVCRYDLAGVVSTKLDKICADDSELRKAWSQKAMRDYQKAFSMLSSQKKMYAILAEAKIYPVILKGTASAYYYPEPMLRRFGDIDFLVLPEQFDECCQILEAHGFEKGVDSQRHIEFTHKGIVFECHRFFSHNLVNSDRTEDELFYAAAKKPLKRSIDGYDFYALPDAEYGIVLLEHLKQHIYRGIGFRQYLDWIVYVDKALNDKIWHENFAKMAEACNLLKFAKVVTRTAQLYLGLDENTNTWCKDVDPALCAKLIQLFFSCENFGYKKEDNKDIRAVGFFSRKGFFAQLHYSAMIHFPAARKYPYLLPLAYVYQFLRWAGNGIALLLQLPELVKKSNKWHEDKKFLDDIGLKIDV